MDAHNAAVSAISQQISSFYERRTPFRHYHGSTNSTRQYKIDRSRMVDTSQLTHVINVDREKKTCLVEPNVPMDQLVDAVMQYDLLPPVVMEFPGITVGGGFAGTGSESSGFKYGFFDRTIKWIEMVLPSGEVTNASETEHQELFYAAAGTYGTLGVTTMLEVQLVEAKPYVELTYHPTNSVSEALEVMQAATQVESNDYVDGILFALDRGVIVTGRLTDGKPAETGTQGFSKATDPWFYIHAERVTRDTLEPVKEWTPVRDYLFRYDRGAFWTGKYAFQYFLLPFDRGSRWALDYFMHTRTMYRALHASGHASKYIVQDLLLPRHTAEDFIQWVHRRFGFYPLWLCPIQKGREMAMHPRLKSIAGEKVKESECFVNVGVWGPGPSDSTKFVTVNRELEHKVRDLGGVKWLYAQAYYTEDEFWDIYDRSWHEALREKYRAGYLPNVYDKVKVDIDRYDRRTATWSGWLQDQVWQIWPVSGVYGVFRTLMERDYLLAR